MASGKKNYFRHSFFARNDEVILELIDRFSYKGYFFWFALLEICGEQASDEYPEFFKFHQSRLYRELRCNKRSLEPVLDFLQTSNKLVWNKNENFYEIRLANFSKYLGKYTNKKEANLTKKRKEKERKENKNINKKNNYTPDDLIQLWNEFMPPKFEFCRGLYSEIALKNFQITSQYVESLDDWKNIFLKCKEIPNLNGDNNLKFKATLNWLVDFNKLEPVLNGAFGAKEKTGMQLLAEKWGLNEQV